MGLLSTRVLVPALKLPAKLVAGPPKRFAQTVGLAFSLAALALHYLFGLSAASSVVLGVLVVFATLESVFAICAGCLVFGVLMRFGLIPADVCERCNNLVLGTDS